MDSTAEFVLPDTFWRVSVKALVYDSHNRLLVFMSRSGEWQMPGGGLEHTETFEQCVKRELAEEIQVGVKRIGDIIFVYQGKTIKGYPKINIGIKVVIDDAAPTPTDDDLVEARFVAKDEFLSLNFEPGESTIKDYADQIWP